MKFASFKKRFLSMLYESLLLFGVLMFFGFIFAVYTQQNHALKFHWQYQFYLFIVLGLYFVWFWLHGGQTLAMKTWKIQLVQNQGTPVTVMQAISRYCLSWLWILPPLAFCHYFNIQGSGIVTLMVLLWMILLALPSYFLPHHVFLTDYWCKTVIVDCA